VGTVLPPFPPAPTPLGEGWGRLTASGGCQVPAGREAQQQGGAVQLQQCCGRVGGHLTVCARRCPPQAYVTAAHFTRAHATLPPPPGAPADAPASEPHLPALLGDAAPPPLPNNATVPPLEAAGVDLSAGVVAAFPGYDSLRLLAPNAEMRLLQAGIAPMINPHNLRWVGCRARKTSSFLAACICGPLCCSSLGGLLCSCPAAAAPCQRPACTAPPPPCSGRCAAAMPALAKRCQLGSGTRSSAAEVGR
jgi:hypothetical protein